MFTAWYTASIVVLVILALVVQTNASRFSAMAGLGWIIMAAILVLDLTAYLYSILGIMGGVRVLGTRNGGSLGVLYWVALVG